MIWANLNIIYQFLNAAHFQEHNILTIIFMKLIFYWYRRLESPCESIKRACKDSDHLHARQFKWNHKTSASICSLCELQRYIDSATRIKNISTNPMAWLNQHIRVTDFSLVAIDQFNWLLAVPCIQNWGIQFSDVIACQKLLRHIWNRDTSPETNIYHSKACNS